jgi:hypothetical protein
VVPAALPYRKDPVPFVREAGWAPGPVRTCVEHLAPPYPSGFETRTVQSIASRNTEYAIPAHIFTVFIIVIIIIIIIIYKGLTIETQRMWNIKTKVIPVIIGATGTISKSI